MAMVMAVGVGVGVGTVSAGTNEVSGMLQRGLFEEEANHNLDAAIQAYQSVITQTDKDHQFTATAIFQLGECYRKQGKTNEAKVEYQRILREFSDQAELVKLSREYAGSSAAMLPPSNQTGSLELQSQVAAAKAEADTYLRQIKGLHELEPEKRRVFAQQHYPNPVLNSLMQDAVKTEQELARKKNDLGNNHPDVQQATVALKTIYQQIDAQVDGIMIGLAEKMNAAKDVMTALEKQVEEEGKLRMMAAFSTSRRVVSMPPSEADEIKRLQAMIKDSPDLIDANNSQGTTPLNEAVKNGQLVVVKFLLDNKADIEGKAKNGGNTPLLSACQSGEKDMVELLISRGADVNAKCNPDNTALHVAANGGYKAIAETLLAHGAQIYARDALGRTPLHVAIDKGFKTLVELFVAHGADVNAVDNTGSTALVSAIAGQNKDMVEFLLANKVDVNFQNKYGMTPLIAAAKGGPLDIPKLLLEHGADVNARLNDKHPSMPRGTALDTAVAANWNGLVELLLEKQADPNATFDLGDVGGIHQRDMTPLILAAEQGQKETAQILLAHKADVNWKNSQGMTAMMWAVDKADREMAALLLDNKADTEIIYNIGNSGGRTVLQYAVGSGRREMAELLLARRAQINARTDAGSTALHLAASAGSSPMVELLLAHGADVNARDNLGQTPLFWAIRAGSKDNVAFLLGRQAEVNLKDKEGHTPLQICMHLEQSPLGAGGDPPGDLPINANGTDFSRIHEASIKIGAILREHGAISELEYGTIRIMRSGQVVQGIVFRRDANGYNNHTLFEVIAYTYPHQLGLAYLSRITGQNRQPELPGFYFPDFAHVKIRRLETNGYTNILSVDLEAALNSGDCSKNLALNWGDIVELPELDHNVSENWEGLSQPIRETLKKCLERHVEIIVKGTTNRVTLAPNPPTGRLPPRQTTLEAEAAARAKLPCFWLSDVVSGAKVLLASSDLTGVKVKRVDQATGKTEWLVFNLEKIDEHSDLWLQDGDVIEVPEKQ